MTGRRKVLKVLYAPGALGPVELMRTLRPVADLVVAVPRPLRDDPGIAMLSQMLPPVFYDPDGPGPDMSGIDGVVTYSDSLVRTAADLAVRHGLPGQSPQTAVALTDKFVQRTTLAEHGVDAVRCALLRHPRDWERAVATVGLPAVVKPTVGSASRNTFPVTDAAAGAALVRELLTPGEGGAPERELILEEMLIGTDQGHHGDYCSVESIVADGKAVHLPLSKLRLVSPFREPGQFCPSHLDAAARAEVTDLADRALKALDFRWGVTHTEIKLTARGPRIIEVNGRMGGYTNEVISHAGGSSLVMHAACLALGENPPFTPPPEDRLAFQFSHLASPTSTCLVRVEGTDRLKKLPGVINHRLLLAPGRPMRPGVSTQELDMLNAVADDHDAMYSLLERVHHLLRFTVRLREEDGVEREVTLSGWELPSAAALKGERA
ncbi:ATP-grasp domain-containing protein [Streptomyces sp. bgisy159]|uniref:ATP-grasp domain-containing protein n=1 Tax=Streptomyces sp. bgisy159 TaxID=3413795 RepID=UPI003F4A0071